MSFFLPNLKKIFFCRHLEVISIYIELDTLLLLHKFEHKLLAAINMWATDLDSPSEWNAGATTMTSKNCYGETAPMSGTTYSAGTYPDQMRVVDTVLREMQSPTYLLDITMLSELRKDGHPSIYSGDLSPEQRANPARSADCSHWCLPGLPDTWNQLFYTTLFS
jgi:hypothetical protein